jgi:hypothetical protein
MDSKQILADLKNLQASKAKKITVDKKVVTELLNIIIKERRRATAASRRKLAQKNKKKQKPQLKNNISERAKK